MATGIPNTSDCGLVVTFSQLKVLLLTHTRAWGLKWVMVR